MLQAIISMAVVGAVFGGLLGFAAQKFAVPVDPKVEQIKRALPGANCGACGFVGCSELADAIATGKVAHTACTVGGTTAARDIAKVLGLEEETEEKEQPVAHVYCVGGRTECGNRYEYDGIPDCRAASMLQGGGFRECAHGCLGLGTCVRACPFGAIYIDRNGLAVVDETKCTGCGRCVAVCPKNIIQMAPRSRKVHVLCSNTEKGAVVRKICKVGCIACKACVKACQYDAIHVEDNLARIDYEKCTNCGECAKKCPTKCIVDFQVGAEAKEAS